MHEQQYKTTTADDEKKTHTWIGKEGEHPDNVPIADQPNIVCLSTYMNMWEAESSPSQAEQTSQRNL